MTAAYGAAGTAAITITSGAALTPALPAGVVAGDLLVAHVFYGGDTAAPDTPSGWSAPGGAIPGSLSTPATNGRAWVFFKKAVGGDAAPAFGTQAVTTPRRARVFSFTGVVDDVALSIVGGIGFGTGTTTPLADTGVTTGADTEDYLCVQLIAGADDTLLPGAMTGETGGDWTIPAGFTAFTSTTGTPDTWMGIQTAVVAPSTTINGGTAATTANDPWGVIGFYIRSAPVGFITVFKSAWDTTTSPKTVVVADALTDDWLFVGVLGDQSPGNDVTACTTSTTAGTTGSWTEPEENVTGTSEPWVSSAVAQVTADGSVTVSVSRTQGGTAADWGFFVVRARGSSGLGVHGQVGSGSAELVNLTVSEGSAVAFLMDSWDPAIGTGWTPSGQTVIEHQIVGSAYGIDIAYWTDQAAGTRDYGTTGNTGTTLKCIALEILAAGAGVALDGTLGVVAQATGSIEAARPITGDVEVVVQPAGALAVTRPLTGTTSSVAELTGDLTVTAGVTELDGTLGVVVQPTGSLAVARPIDGSAGVVTQPTGSVQVARPITGSVGVVAQSTGALSATRPLTATSSVVVALTGDLTVVSSVAYDGHADVVVQTTGSLAVDRPVAGSSGTVIEFTGALSVIRPLTAHSDVVASLSGDVSIAGQVTYTGHIDVVTELTGSLRVTRPVTGSIAVVTQAVGSIQRAAGLSAMSAVVTQLTGDLSTSTAVEYDGHVDVVAALTGALTVARGMDGNVTIVVAPTGTRFLRAALLAGGVEIVAELGAGLGIAKQLDGSLALVIELAGVLAPMASEMHPDFALARALTAYAGQRALTPYAGKRSLQATAHQRGIVQAPPEG